MWSVLYKTIGGYLPFNRRKWKPQNVISMAMWNEKPRLDNRFTLLYCLLSLSSLSLCTKKKKKKKKKEKETYALHCIKFYPRPLSVFPVTRERFSFSVLCVCGHLYGILAIRTPCQMKGKRTFHRWNIQVGVGICNWVRKRGRDACVMWSTCIYPIFVEYVRLNGFVVVSLQQYICPIWILWKRLKKNLDGNSTRMPLIVFDLKKS